MNVGIVLAAISWVFALGTIALQGYFLHYVSMLQRRGCQCALGWERDFMQVVYVISIVAVLAQLAGLLLLHPLVALTFGFSFTLLQLVNLVVARIFIQRVHRDQCACAQVKALVVIDVINWLGIALVALGLVLGFVSLIGKR